MNAIIGAWADSADDISTALSLMTGALKHRGQLTQVEALDAEGGKAVIGCLTHPGRTPQIANSETGIAGINGSFFGRTRDGDAKHVLYKMRARGKGLRQVARERGGFAGLVALRNGLYAFRDVNGLRPLYYAYSPHLAAFASERKALWKIGFEHPTPVPPGSAVCVTPNRLFRIPIARYQRVRERKISFEQASTILRRLLFTAIRRTTKDAGKICVAFSGGLDSALTAAMTKRVGAKPKLVGVGLTDSPEISTLDKFAGELGLPIKIREFDSDSMEEYVRRVLWLIEEPNLMKLSVAIPLHWAAMVGAECGCDVMLCGQGSDELYGGYSKYAKTLLAKGRNALRAQLYRSVVESSQVNYERDDQATSVFPIELRTAFADPDVIKFSLAIPSEFKVRDGGDTVRKWILRDVARKVGLPTDMVWRRKKAIQHGTGVEKAIRKLAKTQRLDTGQYLSETFEHVRMMESMP